MECHSLIKLTYWIFSLERISLAATVRNLGKQADVMSSLPSHQGRTHVLGTPWAVSLVLY